MLFFLLTSPVTIISPKKICSLVACLLGYSIVYCLVFCDVQLSDMKTDHCKVNIFTCSCMSLLPLCTNNALPSPRQAILLTLRRATGLVELVAPSSTVCHLEPDSGLQTIASQSCTSHSSLLVQLVSICSTFLC